MIGAQTLVDPAPFAGWLRQQIVRHGGRDAAACYLGMHGRRFSQMFWEARMMPSVTLRDVDAFITAAGDPGDLVRLYPVDVGHVYDRWCPTCRERVTVDDYARCPWCDAATVAVRADG